MDKSCSDRSNLVGLEAIKHFSRKGAKTQRKTLRLLEMAFFASSFAPLREKFFLIASNPTEFDLSLQLLSVGKRNVDQHDPIAGHREL